MATMERTVEALVSTLESDAVAEVRAEAALSLGRVLAAGTPESELVVAQLLQMLRDSPERWEEASIALATARGTPGLDDELIRILESSGSGEARRGAARALVHVDAPCGPATPDLGPLCAYEDEAGVPHPLF